MEKTTMPFKRPLEDWDKVERTVFDPAGPSLSFIVTDNGMWTEQLGALVPVPPEPDAGKLDKWELRVLDALVDRINREPIPDQTQWSLPVGDDPVGRFLNVTNGATTYQLLSKDGRGGSIRADDALDTLEIAALDVFLHYLEEKYGRYSGDTIIG
ncbi:hypothetical protein AAII07_54850 [Microvirga sp. 0TCS3.31]